MISMNAISSASGAARYYTEQARIEYYANEVVPSAWGGRGLEVAGLEGAVTAEALTRVLAGQVRERVGAELDGPFEPTTVGRTVIDKTTGERVVQHRAGWDLTFAPPKSVSIEAEVFGRQGVRDAHEQAVTAAMDYLEAQAAQTRYQHQPIATGNLVYARFAHATSRAGDPQTHTHVLVANLTYLDGKAYSLSNEQLLRQRTTADAVYRNELAHGLTRLGYRLDFDGRGQFEIAGYDRAQLADFSKRSAQIDELLQQRGSSKAQASHDARQTASLATRDDKALGHSEDAAAHRERWQAEALARGIAPARPMGFAAHANLELDLQPATSAHALVASAADSLAEREQTFARRDLVKEALLQSSGRVSSPDLLTEISAQATAGALIARESDWSGERFTTPAAIASERWADRQLEAGRGAHAAVLTQRQFEIALARFEYHKRFELTPEQRDAAHQILTRTDQFSGVQGAAGTGKTTMLAFVREAAEYQGWTVQGVSTGAAQASQLQAESGIASTTTAAFLGRHRQGAASNSARLDAPGQTRHLVINDEASMSGQRDFNGVIQAALDTGAKAVFVGDKAQHQSVAAGSAFERAQDAMPMAGLTQINRQTTEAARAPVRSIVAGHHADAIRKTAREFSGARDQVTDKWQALATEQGDTLTRAQASRKRDDLQTARGTDNQAAIGAIASDYARLDPDQRERSAVITGTNADRQALNQAIRSRLIEAGELSPRSVEVATLQRKDLTRAQAAQASSYVQGDVLLPPAVLKRSGRAGRAPATPPDRTLTVEAIDAQRNTVTVRAGAEISTLDAQALAGMTAYTVQPRAFAVGDRVAFFENAKALGVQNGDLATVVQVDATGMTVQMQGRQDAAGKASEKTIPFDQYRQLDHGYVMTSHKAQGRTVDRSFVHHNTEAGMHGQREAYVNVTRARLATTTYTQDRERAAEQASRAVDKTRAIHAAERVVGKPGRAKRGERARSPEQSLQAPEGVRSRALSHTHSLADELRFEPASYADVTLKPGERLDVGGDLLAEPRVSGLVSAKEAIAHMFDSAERDAGRFAAERDANSQAEAEAFGRDAARQFEVVLTERDRQQAAERALERSIEKASEQAPEQTRAPEHVQERALEPERKRDRERDQGLSL